MPKYINLPIENVNVMDSLNRYLAKVIQNDDADCGLGVYSAAKVFDLDFIPLCDEEYDLLLDKKMLESEYIKTLLRKK